MPLMTGFPHLAQVNVSPRARRAVYRARSCRWVVPYPRWAGVPRAWSWARVQVGQRRLPAGMSLGQSMQRRLAAIGVPDEVAVGADPDVSASDHGPVAYGTVLGHAALLGVVGRRELHPPSGMCVRLTSW